MVARRSQVVPRPVAAVAAPPRNSAPHHVVRVIVQPFVRAWRWLQVGSRGTYSVERAIALSEYCDTVSLVRVFAVLLCVPMPTLFILFIIDSMPLAPVSAGWEANHWFMAQNFVILLTVGFSMSTQGRHLIRGLTLSKVWLLVLSLAVAIFFVVFLLFMEAYWAFPLPFIMVTFGIPFGIGWLLVFLAAAYHNLGRNLSRQNRMDIVGFMTVINLQCLPIALYPVYNAIFDILQPQQQAGFVLVLPVFKTVLKKLMSIAVTHMEDCVPEYVVFSVECFNALYLMSCMQNAGSNLTTVLILASDTLTNMFSLYGLHKHSVTSAHNDGNDLLATLVSSLRDAATLDRRALTTIRLHASLPHHLTQANTTLLAQLKQLNLFTGHEETYWQKRRAQRRRAHGAISPSSRKVLGPNTTAPQSMASSTLALIPVRQGSTTDRAVKLHEALRMLFHTEYIVLTEYVECIVPVMYVIYLPILWRMPNHIYFPHIRDMDATQWQHTLLKIALYSTLEFVSLLAMHMLLKRRYGFSVLHQLAFVVEHHAQLIIAKITPWLIFSLQFTCEHRGSDFTFKFEWMRKPAVTT